MCGELRLLEAIIESAIHNLNTYIASKDFYDNLVCKNDLGPNEKDLMQAVAWLTGESDEGFNCWLEEVCDFCDILPEKLIALSKSAIKSGYFIYIYDRTFRIWDKDNLVTSVSSLERMVRLAQARMDLLIDGRVTVDEMPSFRLPPTKQIGEMLRARKNILEFKEGVNAK